MRSTRGDSNRIDEELVCIDSLVQRLKELNPDQAIAVRREPKDPPDFWIGVAGSEYAAEVTSIVTDQSYVGLCEEFVESIRTEAEARSCVNGKYALFIQRKPEIPRKGTKSWKQLVSTSVAAIRAMSASSAGAEIPLPSAASGYLALMKVSDTGNTVGLVRIPELKWEGEVRRELSRLLQQAVNTKLEKIERRGVINTCPDVILVLYDAYGYGDIEDARQALGTVRGYERFHSVFWAASFSDRQNALYPDSPGRSGVFLYSKNGSWR